MAPRFAAALVAITIAVTACGGSDGKSAATSTTTSTTASTTTSTAGGPTTTGESTFIAGPHGLAAIVVQIDDQMRRNVDLADACIHGPHDQCTGRAQGAYTTLDDLAGAVSLLTQAVTKGNSFYVGELPKELVGLYDASLDAGVSAKAASADAQRACLPKPSSGCDDASKKLDDALIALYKIFNQWRALL